MLHWIWIHVVKIALGSQIFGRARVTTKEGTRDHNRNTFEESICALSGMSMCCVNLRGPPNVISNLPAVTLKPADMDKPQRIQFHSGVMFVPPPLFIGSPKYDGGPSVNEESPSQECNGQKSMCRTSLTRDGSNVTAC